MSKRRLCRILPLLLVAVLGSCSFLEPLSDRSQFFVLTSIDDERPSVSMPLVVGLGPIRFPDYLQRSELVVRTNDHRLEYSQNLFWAEPLEGNFQRVLSENLARRLQGAEILTHPWYVSTPPSYDVPIEVLRFEADASGAAQLHARWSVRESKAKRVLDSGEARLRQEFEGDGPDVKVAALSRSVGQLSDQIAAALAKAESKR